MHSSPTWSSHDFTKFILNKISTTTSVGTKVAFLTYDWLFATAVTLSKSFKNRSQIRVVVGYGCCTFSCFLATVEPPTHTLCTLPLLKKEEARQLIYNNSYLKNDSRAEKRGSTTTNLWRFLPEKTIQELTIRFYLYLDTAVALSLYFLRQCSLLHTRCVPYHCRNKRSFTVITYTFTQWYRPYGQRVSGSLVRAFTKQINYELFTRIFIICHFFPTYGLLVQAELSY